MKKLLNSTIKLKYILIVFSLLAVCKFGLRAYQTHFYMEVSDKYPPVEAFDIITKERAEKWWLRL